MATRAGDIVIERVSYHIKTGGTFTPLDYKLGIHLMDTLSAELEKDLAYVGALLPYREAKAVIARLKGSCVSHTTIQRCTNDVGEAAKHVELRALKNHRDKKYLAFQVDGGRVNTYDGWRETKTAVIENGFDVVQTTTIADHNHFMNAFCAEIKKQGYHTDPTNKALLSDGARWIGDDFGQYFPRIIQILDYYHFKEHLYATAKELFGEADLTLNKQWVDKHVQYCFDNKIKSLIISLKKQQLTFKPKSPKHESLRLLINYIENNKHRLSYSKYRELGLPIGSGQVEATIKKMNGPKLKSGSVRWRLPNVKKVLALRTVIFNGQFDNIKYA